VAPPVPTILDCDPGHDDMVAILLAAAHPGIDLLAITTVAGNGTLERTTYNARAVCGMAGIRDVPIAAGGLTVGEEALRHDEVEVVLRPCHRDIDGDARLHIWRAQLDFETLVATRAVPALSPRSWSGSHASDSARPRSESIL
jgi:hypothetical protein